MKGILAAACIAICPMAHAASPTCEAFATAIETSLKNAALRWADGIGDNSAVRAQLSEAKIANEYAEIQINLRLMIENKCPVPTKPLTYAKYMTDALTCKNDRLRAELKDSTDSPPSCSVEKWKGFADSK